MPVAVLVRCRGSFAGADNIDLNPTAMASREDGNDEHPTTAHGQQQHVMKQDTCFMTWVARKPRKKRMMATHPSNSTSSVTDSWENVSQPDSCRFPESDYGLPEEDDQKSAVLDGSVDGQALGPASPDKTTLFVRSAPSDEESVFDEIFDDDDCAPLSENTSEAGSSTPTADQIASQ